ncbi:MAG: hypothetical protein AAFQ05_02880 [Pseudomonadota bacterium]
MDLKGEIEAIETEAQEAGLAMRRFCQMADIAETTWMRWKNDLTAPNSRTWQRVEKARVEMKRGAA